METEGMSVKEAGKKGGSETMRRHGREFFVALGKRGGESTLRRYGNTHYHDIGSKGGSEMSRLAALGRIAELKEQE